MVPIFYSKKKTIYKINSLTTNRDSRCVVPPLVMSTTFKQFAPGEHAGYEYGRSGNPTRNALEACLAPLEKAKYALTFASGLGALTTLSYLLKSGDHIVTVDDVYGGTNRFFRNCASRFGIETSFVDMADLAETKNVLRENTAFCWIGNYNLSLAIFLI